ncbi:50S ribosomal protein L15 [Ilumatobacter sp.]|uniref:50S ribosomal protein L15 n=1 Tax=Ilumatobacter sp. TaxID=1967498 RepID=UPI003B51D0D3
MKVHDLKPAEGSTRSRKRVGRGIGGKGGKTAGRGTKGQRARNTVRRGFEGGQMPLKQRVPKLKGFNNPFRVEYQAINLHTLADLAERVDGAITPEVLAEHGLVRKGSFVKILARGEVSSALEVSAHAASRSAVEAIEAAGGSITMITLPFREEGRAGRPAAQGNQFMNR